MSLHMLLGSLDRNVGLVVVGPEVPLVAGLANDLVKAGTLTFGPSSQAAALEGSKNFMKDLCHKYNIPTAKVFVAPSFFIFAYSSLLPISFLDVLGIPKTFSDASAAKEYTRCTDRVKADGLAAGKGVTVALKLEEAFEAVDSMLVKGVFDSAGCQVIVEEFLEGEEASFFALVDGENAIPLESAQDHKRVGDGDTGPNTGGMGAYSPAPVLTKELQDVVMDTMLPETNGYKRVSDEKAFCCNLVLNEETKTSNTQLKSVKR
ncbi:phosphoribosylamine--glycine ligase, chloroplastic-like [Eutrema salsugineum]|uniref:phosphoribosylamine--glycine ligase, chloroplastic-like n=1 Tax=Eutrema salsugineum TaxID=72664 RepID=UPI000CED73D5|nr:phosphoribosylamine--glycine ligase, chloroplastic-like [Eutrema salsugineum]